jgi:hypothetical protein
MEQAGRLAGDGCHNQAMSIQRRPLTSRSSARLMPENWSPNHQLLKSLKNTSGGTKLALFLSEAEPPTADFAAGLDLKR